MQSFPLDNPRFVHDVALIIEGTHDSSQRRRERESNEESMEDS